MCRLSNRIEHICEAVAGIYYVWYRIRKSVPLALHRDRVANAGGRNSA